MFGMTGWGREPQELKTVKFDRILLLLIAGWILMTPIISFCSANPSLPVPEDIAADGAEPVLNPIFEEGEELVYQASWMGIKAGTITITLYEKEIYLGQPVFKATIVGRTSKTFSKFFEVEDVIESTFSRETFNSIHYVKNIREGKYRKVKETVYDQDNREAWNPDMLEKKYELQPNSMDPIACIFNLRRKPLKPGMIVKMNANSEGKHCYPVEVRIEEKDRVKIPAGKYMALVGKPLPTWEGRMFEKQKSKLIVWLSDDEYLVPLKIKMKVKIGSLKALLISRKGPGWEIEGETDI